MKNKNFSFMAGLIFGGFIGAILIFILGTKEGKKLAEKFGSKAEEFETDLEKKVTELKKQGESFINDAEEVKKEIEASLNEKKDTVSKEVMSKMNDTLEKIETIQTQGVKMTQDVRKKFFKKNGRVLS